MIDSDLKILDEKKAGILAGMAEFMSAGDEDFDPGYTEADIEKCDMILQDFIAGLQKLGEAAAESEMLKCVKKAVLDLNTLNESVGGGLIETGQREDLCDYILYAIRQSGFKTEDDVTEEWREW